MNTLEYFLLIIIVVLLAFIISQKCKLSKNKLLRKKIRADRHNLYQEKIEINKQNLALEGQNRLHEADRLKFQLQPHTVNNILANLRSLSRRMSKGMDSLSETLDYILYKGSDQMVSIEDEILFLKKYLDLQDLFIVNIDAIKLEKSRVDEASPYYTKNCIPHLVSAYFIENAFKHGDTNHPEFLRIKISLTGHQFELRVVNRIATNKVIKPGGIGLANMEKRLSILLNQKFEIKNSRSDFEYHTSLTVYLN